MRNILSANMGLRHWHLLFNVVLFLLQLFSLSWALAARNKRHLLPKRSRYYSPWEFLLCLCGACVYPPPLSVPLHSAAHFYSVQPPFPDFFSQSVSQFGIVICDVRQCFCIVASSCHIISKLGNWATEIGKKGLQIFLSRTQSGRARTLKQKQEEI